jgi:NAD(P)-dependent dehydrogenase (short-subunit alcohol dehydrogenase family)
MIGEGFLPDLVVLNAGVYEREEGFSLDRFDRLLGVNLRGALVWVEAFLPGFLERGSGHFAAVASLSAYYGTPGAAAYCAGKGALALAMESLRVRYQPQGIGFTTVYLGFMESAMTAGQKLPWLSCTPDQAAHRIARAVDRGRPTVHYPLLQSCAARFLAALPRGWYDGAVRKLYALTR